MRIALLILILIISSTTFAQLRKGFNPNEAKALIAICNSYTFLNLYNSDSTILPKEYQKVFTSEVIGLDNLFQVYEGDSVGVINFRGSTARFSSWMENMYSAMIPSQGVIKINYKKCPYYFAKDTSAAVHSGYALTVVLLSSILTEQINTLNNKGIFNIIFNGHSQGGALAHLSRAYFENLPADKISSKNVFKTYAFANPMCGNIEFAVEYKTRYCETDMSYSIINPTDGVPKMPMHYDEDNRLNMTRFKGWIAGKESIDIGKLGKDFVLRKLDNGLASYVNFSNKLIEKLVSKTSVPIEMPDYTRDVNYFQVGTIKLLEPFPYPKIAKDSSLITEKKPEEDKGFYKKEPSFFQHKPYNYYVAILKEYFSDDYENLKVRYLPENL